MECTCGSRIGNNPTILHVALMDITKEYLFCSEACMRDRLAKIKDVNREMGVEIEVQSFWSNDGKYYLILKEKELV